jgi:hypothetical protein
MRRDEVGRLVNLIRSPGVAVLAVLAAALLVPATPASAQSTAVVVHTTQSGARVRIAVAPGYEVPEAEQLRWAEYLDSLVHGPELETVTIYLASAEQLRTTCAGGFACYLPRTQSIHFTPIGGPDVITAEAVLAHEYGHHVAHSRVNPPWDATVYGTKRWASYLRVCERVRARELYARGPWGMLYRLNPAEGFAEAYRLLNERRRAVPESPWLIVDDRLYPDQTALSLLERDVLDPWTAPTTLTVTGRGTRTVRVATPLDGPLTVKVRSSRGSAYSAFAPSTVCGERSVPIRVYRLRGNGTFRLTVTRP